MVKSGIGSLRYQISKFPHFQISRLSMDPEYKKMMTWVAIALVASIVAALVIVELVIRRYGP